MFRSALLASSALLLLVSLVSLSSGGVVGVNAACTTGQYSLSSGVCVDCTAGYECPNPVLDRVACSIGYYSSASSTSCTVCPVGSKCPNTSTIAACSAGQYSFGASTTCTTCPVGFMCPTTAAPVSCSPGSYQTATGKTTCLTCSAGFYCPDAVNPPQPCPTGTHRWRHAE